MFTLMAATVNLQCSTGRRGEWQNIGRSGCYVFARSRAKAIKDSSSDEGDAMSPPWRPSRLLALAHASIGYLVDASLGARRRYRAIAMIPAMVAHNTDLSAWLSAFALHPTSTAPRSDGIPDDIQLAGCVETSAAQGLMHSSLMTCGNKGTNQSDYLGAGSSAAASRHCSISIRRRPMRRSAPPRSSSCAS